MIIYRYWIIKKVYFLKKEDIDVIDNLGVMLV